MANYRTDYKNGKVRYKRRYREYDEFKSKVVQRETGWHFTKKEADLEYYSILSGEKIKKDKKTVLNVLNEFKDYLEKKANASTIKKKTTEIEAFYNCRSLIKH